MALLLAFGTSFRFPDAVGQLTHAFFVSHLISPFVLLNVFQK
jgi:hypothetical protein